NVIGIRLKGQPPDRDLLFSQNPKRIADKLEKALLLSRVNALHFFQKMKWNTELLADLDERSHIFRKTGTTISDAGIEKLAADAPVHSDSVCDFFHVCSAGVADRGYGINVG